MDSSESSAFKIIIKFLVSLFALIIMTLLLIANCKTAHTNGIAANAASSRANGLYVWTAIPTDDLIALAQETSVGEIYYSIPELSDIPTSEVLKSCSEMIMDCHNAGIAVWFLTGDPTWGANEICAAVEAVATYNKNADDVSRFVGIQIDFEPYTNKEWNEEDWYIALLAGKNKADELNVRVMICIPRWIDTLDETLLERLIRDCCDEVAVMAYDRRTEIVDIEKEVVLAHKYDKPLVCVSELSKPISEINDYNTYYSVGLPTLYASWDTICTTYKTNLRFAYHHAEVLQKMTNT